METTERTTADVDADLAAKQQRQRQIGAELERTNRQLAETRRQLSAAIADDAPERSALAQRATLLSTDVEGLEGAAAHLQEQLEALQRERQAALQGEAQAAAQRAAGRVADALDAFGAELRRIFEAQVQPAIRTLRAELGRVTDPDGMEVATSDLLYLEHQNGAVEARINLQIADTPAGRIYAALVRDAEQRHLAAVAMIATLERAGAALAKGEEAPAPLTAA